MASPGGAPLTVSSDQGWIILDSTILTFPTTTAVCRFTIDPTGLREGEYLGHVTLKQQGGGGATASVPVSLIWGGTGGNGGSGLTADPAALALSVALSAKPLQSVRLVLTNSSGYTANVVATVHNPDAPGLVSVTPSRQSMSAGASADFIVHIAGSELPTGVYKSLITLSDTLNNAGRRLVPFAVCVGATGACDPSGGLSVDLSNASRFIFTGNQTAGYGNPLISNETSSNLDLAIESSNPTLLSPVPESLPLPAHFPALSYLFADALGLPLGHYYANLLFIDTSGTAAWTSAQGQICITRYSPDCVSTAPATPQAVLNGASGVSGPIAPGEIISIYGVNLGPDAGAGLTLASNGLVSKTLAGTQVLFDDFPAPLTYVSAKQINAIVPYEIAGRLSTVLTVQSLDYPAGAISLRVADTAPAIFSLDQSGNGQGAILNQDFSVNDNQHPAHKGDVISIYATGIGLLKPAAASGSITPSDAALLPSPVNDVSVTIGGAPAQVLYAGPAPGFVSGLVQVNATVPASLGLGSQTVAFKAGSTSNSGQTVTVYVQ